MIEERRYRMYDKFFEGYKEIEVKSDRENLAENLEEAFNASGDFFYKSPCVVIESPIRNRKKVQISRDALFSKAVWKQAALQLVMSEDNYVFSIALLSDPTTVIETFSASEENFTQGVLHKLNKNAVLRNTDLSIQCTSMDCLGFPIAVLKDDEVVTELFTRLTK